MVIRHGKARLCVLAVLFRQKETKDRLTQKMDCHCFFEEVADSSEDSLVEQGKRLVDLLYPATYGYRDVQFSVRIASPSQVSDLMNVDLVNV